MNSDGGTPDDPLQRARTDQSIGSPQLERDQLNEQPAMHTWFVTSQFDDRYVDGFEVLRRPAGLRHAKTFGTGRTKCGLNANSWPKFWDRPFLGEAVSERCPRCSELFT